MMALLGLSVHLYSLDMSDFDGGLPSLFPHFLLLSKVLYGMTELV